MIEQLRANGGTASPEEPSASPIGDTSANPPHPTGLAAVSSPPNHGQMQPNLVPAAVDLPIASSAAGSATVPGLAPNPWPHAPQDVELSTARPGSAGVAGPAPGPEEPSAAELRVDEHGKILYYGPTSAVHDRPQPDPLHTPATTAQARTSDASTKDEESLSCYVREASIWEDFALGNASLQTGIPRHMLAKLLRLHWTWVSPMFMWVYRPAFIREYHNNSMVRRSAADKVASGDMATGGRYYSEFLLTVMCGHAAKYQDNNSSEFLLARARRLLGAAIQQPSSIPTVQALLQLSARDLAHGSISQAWVYGGIAFRMASDLGLQHRGTVIKGLSPLDLEIRRRLFWGCYFWDKYANPLRPVWFKLRATSWLQFDANEMAL